jgi:hypothetical protein
VIVTHAYLIQHHEQIIQPPFAQPFVAKREGFLPTWPTFWRGVFALPITITSGCLGGLLQSFYHRIAMRILQTIHLRSSSRLLRSQ